MSQAVVFLSALRPHEFTALVRKHHPWLRPAQAAAYLDVSKRTLEQWRASGRGPAYHGTGKNIRYNVESLDAFIYADTHNDQTGD
jgi:excisionase family DNA binding protein